MIINKRPQILIMKLLSIIIVLAVSKCLSADTPILPYRHSADFRIFFIYFTKHIAITKSTITEGDGADKTYFCIGRASWVGEPDLADTTGDRMDTDIAPRPRQIGTDRDSCIHGGNSHIVDLYALSPFGL